MTPFIIAKLKKSDDQTNIDKYKVAENITEYHIISKLIFLRIIIPKFMMKRQKFHVKNVCKNVKNRTDGPTLIIEYPRFKHSNDKIIK